MRYLVCMKSNLKCSTLMMKPDEAKNVSDTHPVVSCSTPLGPTAAAEDGDDTFQCFLRGETDKTIASLHCLRILSFFVVRPNLTSFGKECGVQLFSHLSNLTCCCCSHARSVFSAPPSYASSFSGLCEFIGCPQFSDSVK